MSPVPASSRRTRNSMWVRMAARLTGRSAVAVLVAALVLGILGMHALANHGAPAPPGTASSTMSMTGAAAVTSAHEEAMASGDSHDGHTHSTATQSSTAPPGPALRPVLTLVPARVTAWRAW